MAQHTPGPWMVPHLARDEVNCNCGYVLAEPYMGAVATVHYTTPEHDPDGDNPPLDEAKANARLIAEAPYLLGVLHTICHTYYDSSIGGRAKRAEVMRELAAIAIAKAEGK